MSQPSLQQKFESIRSNKVFEFFVIFIIIFSAMVVGAKTYNIPPATLRLMAWLDTLITVIFLVEITIRFLGEKQKGRFFMQGWNIFDTLIVIVSLIPVENSEVAFVGRLVRVFRVLRMVSIIPELRTLINSLLKAMPQLGYIVLLMFIIFYIYGAAGAILFKTINPELWGDVGLAMLTLFRVMTFEDWTDVMYETMAVYPLSWAYYLSFIFLTAFAFLNMVIGIMVNAIEQEHLEKGDQPDPAIIQIQNEINELKEILLRMEKKA